MFGVTEPKCGSAWKLPSFLQECTVEKAKEIEGEGSAHLVQSGTGAITSGTAVGTNLSFYNGYLRCSQEARARIYILTGARGRQRPGAAGDIRVRAERYAG